MTTAAMGIGRGTQLTLEKEIRFPHSLGLLYSVFTTWLGFEVNEGEYKVMGMASYGQPHYADNVRKLLELADDGSFWLDMKYFSYHQSMRRTFNRKFVDLFGEPRDSKSNFFTPGTGYPSYFGDGTNCFPVQFGGSIAIIFWGYFEFLMSALGSLVALHYPIRPTSGIGDVADLPLLFCSTMTSTLMMIVR